MINVIDSIMGSGKTTWAANYINSHPDKRFIYVVPFLKSCYEMIERCPSADFFAPTDSESTKTESFRKALAEKRNMCISHELMKRIDLSDDEQYVVAMNEYVLILDEVVEVLVEQKQIKKEFDQDLVARYIFYDEETRLCKWMYDEETDLCLDIKRMADSNSLIKSSGSYFWKMPLTFLRSFNDVYILTFMFESSHMAHYLDVYKLPYIKLHIDSKGELREGEQDLTDKKAEIRSLLHIYKGKMNEHYENKFALSANWYNTKATPEMLHTLLNNARNFFRRPIYVKAENAMYSTYSIKPYKLKYTNLKLNGKYLVVPNYKADCNVPFNCKATNYYRDRTHMAYMVNLFEHPGVQQYFEYMGSPLDTDLACLSTMIQWIWRSAIRNNEEAWLYIPAVRMRTILTDWLNS